MTLKTVNLSYKRYHALSRYEVDPKVSSELGIVLLEVLEQSGHQAHLNKLLALRLECFTRFFEVSVLVQSNKA